MVTSFLSITGLLPESYYQNILDNMESKKEMHNYYQIFFKILSISFYMCVHNHHIYAQIDMHVCIHTFIHIHYSGLIVFT